MTRKQFIECVEAGVEAESNTSLYAALRNVAHTHTGPVARGGYLQFLPDGGTCGCPAALANVRQDVCEFPFAFDSRSRDVLCDVENSFPPTVFEVVE